MNDHHDYDLSSDGDEYTPSTNEDSDDNHLDADDDLLDADDDLLDADGDLVGADNDLLDTADGSDYAEGAEDAEALAEMMHQTDAMPNMVPGQRLFNHEATAADIIDDIRQMFLTLSTSDYEVAAFAARLRTLLLVPPVFPEIHPNPSTWADSDDPQVDAYWARCIEEEPKHDAPKRCSSKKSHRVKPFGTFQAPLMVVSSYPTMAKNSTVHMDFATANDLSNSSMASLLTKLRYHRPGIRNTAMLHVDVLQVRMD